MNTDADRLLARIARLEAQSDIRGRAVVIYRERAREAEAQVEAWRKQYEYDTARLWDDLDDADDDLCEAEAERDEWRQTALDERAAALDALEQIKARDARAADIWDEGWAQGMAYVVGMERGTDDDDLDHATTNPYRASEGK